MPDNASVSGECRCGRVKLRLHGEPIFTTACHCRGCQRMSSSAFSLTAIYQSNQLEVEGETVIGGLHGATKHNFCAYCMSWLFTRPEQMDEIVNVRPTMLENARDFRPFAETSTRTMLPWAVTGAVRSFEGFPDMPQYQELIAAYDAWKKG